MLNPGSSFGNALAGLGATAGGMMGVMGPLSGAGGGPFATAAGNTPLMGPMLAAAGGGPVLQTKQISDLWRNTVHPIMRAGPQGPGEDEEVAAEDEEDMGVIETYSNYMPSKLKVGETRIAISDFETKQT